MDDFRIALGVLIMLLLALIEYTRHRQRKLFKLMRDHALLSMDLLMKKCPDDPEVQAHLLAMAREMKELATGVKVSPRRADTQSRS